MNTYYASALAHFHSNSCKAYERTFVIFKLENNEQNMVVATVHTWITLMTWRHYTIIRCIFPQGSANQQKHLQQKIYGFHILDNCASTFWVALPQFSQAAYGWLAILISKKKVLSQTWQVLMCSLCYIIWCRLVTLFTLWLDQRMHVNKFTAECGKCETQNKQKVKCDLQVVWMHNHVEYDSLNGSFYILYIFKKVRCKSI